MRVVSQRMTDVWQSGQFTGKNRPIARVTIQRTQLLTRPNGNERFASYAFGNPNNVYELPNVKSVQWQRSVESDAASATITLYNTRELPIGVKPPTNELYNQPGYFTFNRGDMLNRWNHTTNQWSHRLYPDQLIRTYEGYGYDPALPAETDPNMMPSGVWLIDDVELGADSTLVLKCRDAVRLLLDQVAFPPVVPSALYPLHYEKRVPVAYAKVPVVSGGGGMTWINPSYYDDSGTPYVGRNGGIGGHRASDAFDGTNTSYWLSVGNSSPTAPYAYEWIEGSIPISKVAAVRVYTKGGPYRMYVSLHDGVQNKWLGVMKVPYDPNNAASAPNGADLLYIKSVSVAADSDVTVDLTDTPDVDRIRITFHDLWDSNFGTYQYRAAVRDFDVLTTTASTRTTFVAPSPPTHLVGNYDDYTDIVKLLLGYGGFLWPRDPTAAYQMHSAVDPTHPYSQQPGTRVDTPPTAGELDPVIGIGAIWGTLEQSGTFGPAPLTAAIFDKKPLMDGIAYIRDMLGFIFYCDEVGAAVFRSPNIWSLGNVLTPQNYRLDGVVPQSFTETFARPNSTVVGNGWTEVGADFSVDTQRAVCNNAVGYLVRDFGRLSMTVQCKLRSPDGGSPAAFCWGNSSDGAQSGYAISFNSAAVGTNVILIRNGTQVAAGHYGPAGYLIGNADLVLRLSVVSDGTNVGVVGYVNGTEVLTFQEALSAAPTGTFTGAGIRGRGSVSLDDFVVGEARAGGPVTRTTDMVTIDERQTLIGLRAGLSSRNVRERVLVANMSGHVGAVTKGFLPYRLPETGLRRISIYSDQHFQSAQECQIMADLIAVRQLFTYRTDRITIPAYPAIQIDDQVKILEETTEETGEAHYVKGISSNLDMSSGEWTYELDTHWLGSQPFTGWAFDPANLDPATQQYLADLGKV